MLLSTYSSHILSNNYQKLFHKYNKNPLLNSSRRFEYFFRRLLFVIQSEAKNPLTAFPVILNEVKNLPSINNVIHNIFHPLNPLLNSSRRFDCFFRRLLFVIQSEAKNDGNPLLNSLRRLECFFRRLLKHFRFRVRCWVKQK